MKNNFKRIGVFDSGIGGLSVLKELVSFSDAEFIYLADTANLPYGEKSKELLEQLTYTAISFLVAQEVDAVVIACHTASANAGDFVRKKFPLLPIFDVVTPVVHQALNTTQNNRIGVMGTQATITSQIHRKKIIEVQSETEVILQACPRLVPLIEIGLGDMNELYDALEEYITPLVSQNCDSLIIGCTHYELIKEHIQKVAGPTITLISAPHSTRTSMNLQHVENKTSSVTCYVTKGSLLFKSNAQLMLGWELENIKEISLSSQLYSFEKYAASSIA